MARNDLITKDFALYVVHYFASMLTWSKEDILSEIDRTIKEATPVDAVRVIRCKNCVCYEEICSKYGYCYHWDYEQGMSPNQVEPDDFCSYGERKK